MSEEKALIPLEQKTIDFYGDEIIAVLVTTLPTNYGLKINSGNKLVMLRSSEASL